MLNHPGRVEQDHDDNDNDDDVDDYDDDNDVNEDFEMQWGEVEPPRES